MQATHMLHYHADWKIAYAQSSPTITKFQAGMCTKTFFLLLSMITVAKQTTCVSSARESTQEKSVYAPFSDQSPSERQVSDDLKQ